MTTRYKVVSALVLATVDNKVHYVYQNGLVPLGADQAKLDAWTEQGLVEKIEVADSTDDPAVALASALDQLGMSREQATALLQQGAVPAVPGDETGDGEVSGADTAKLPDGAPGKSASKATWVDYAVTRGVDRAAAEASTKEELINTIAAQAA